MGVIATSYPAVLILTNEQDVSADWVVRELRRKRVPYLRLNTERLTNWRVSIDPTAGQWQMWSPQRRVDFSRLRSVWYRRPESPRSDQLDQLTKGQRALVVEQWQGLLSGLAALPVRWINDPTVSRRCESKILQLGLAQRAGLDVPKTAVTNDIDTLGELASTGKWIIKGLSAPLLDELHGDSAFVFTEWLTPEVLVGTESSAQAPMIVQEAVWPKQDVRVTIIGENLFAALTTAPTLDWRVSHQSVAFETHALPREIIEGCFQLVRDLGLEFAAIDLLIDDSGHYQFLEVNPNGEWGWLQKSLELPIGRALADRLSS